MSGGNKTKIAEGGGFVVKAMANGVRGRLDRWV